MRVCVWSKQSDHPNRRLFILPPETQRSNAIECPRTVWEVGKSFTNVMLPLLLYVLRMQGVQFVSLRGGML